MLSRNYIFFIIIFGITLCCASQTDQIKAADLIGSYVLEIPENPQNKEEFIFKKKEQKSYQSSGNTVFLELAEDEVCILSTDTNKSQEGYDWHYNKDSGLVLATYAKEFLNALKENDAELFLRIQEDQNTIRMELSVFRFEDGSIGLKILNWK